MQCSALRRVILTPRDRNVRLDISRETQARFVSLKEFFAYGVRLLVGHILRDDGSECGFGLGLLEARPHEILEFPDVLCVQKA